MLYRWNMSHCPVCNKLNTVDTVFHELPQPFKNPRSSEAEVFHKYIEFELDKQSELEKKVSNLETELERVSKNCSYWYNLSTKLLDDLNETKTVVHLLTKKLFKEK